MEELLRRAIEEGEGEGGVLETIADRIARGRPARPRGLKRFETAP